MAGPELNQQPKSRSTGFPSMPLDEAVRAIKNAGKYGREHALAAFAGYLGHKSISGPFRAKMASLKDWGLIERPRGDRVPLTDLSMRLAHPTSGDEERSSVREAFFHAEPFKKIYNDSAKEIDLSLDVIGNRAVTGLGVAPPSKERFADSFLKSVVFAGLGRPGSKGSVHLLPVDSPSFDPSRDGQDELQDQPGSLAAKGQGPTVHPAAVAHPVRKSGPPTLHQSWALNSGTVLFEVRLQEALPVEAFAPLTDVMKAVEIFVGSLRASSEASAGKSSHNRTDDASN